jgi:hypothetical protein
MMHITLALALGIAPPQVVASDTSFRPGWIGLYSPAQIARLEQGTPAEPLTVRIVVRASPDRSAAIVGVLEVSATPGRGLVAVARIHDQAVSFIPDLVQDDWGYSAFFHQSVVDRHGAWLKIPRRPLPESGWILPESWSPRPDYETVDSGTVYLSPRGDLTIIAVNRGTIRARPEAPEDMWCQEGDPPRGVLPPIRWFTLQDFLDGDGHLTLKPKYPRGC